MPYPFSSMHRSKQSHPNFNIYTSIYSLEYTGEYVTVDPPREERIYIDKLTALELARQVYASLFGRNMNHSRAPMKGHSATWNQRKIITSKL